jgi:hypothetical protein
MPRQQTDLNLTALVDRRKVSRFGNNPKKLSYGTRSASRKNFWPACLPACGQWLIDSYNGTATAIVPAVR